jgi:hypothetical protein
MPNPSNPKKPIVALTEALLSSNSLRKSFRNDPVAVSQFAGISGLTTQELDALSSLSEQELQVLASVNARMSANLDDTNGYVVF